MMNYYNFLILILLVIGAAHIDGAKKLKAGPQQPLQETIVRTDIQGRLLTPEEGCGYSKAANNRIVGGAPAKNGAWPWMALLGTKSGWSFAFKCGGSLITSRHILTAAHCLQVPNSPLTFARLGEYDTQSFSDGKHEDIDIVRQVPHEKWSRKLLIYDIAVLELARDVEFSDRISPICLPDSGNIQSRSLVGMNPFVAGWGHTREKGRMANILQQVQLPIISNAECKKKYSYSGRIVKDIQYSDVVICAGVPAGGKDSCQGDSGGPMMLPIHEEGRFPYYQIGINSYGLGCARPNIPGVYTNVRQFMDWIKSKLYE